MKIILRQDIEKIGKTGDIKDVKPGFARNYLFPKCLAVPATEKNLSILKQEKERIEKQKKSEMEKLKEVVEKLNKLSLNINVKVGESGKLFGVVTKEDILDALKSEVELDIDKQDILLEEPIKETGIYNIGLKIRSAVFPKDVSETAKLKVWVVESK